MVNTFFTKERIIKDNVLTAEVTRAKNEININFRIIRMGIKGI
jgi:hypothetical protein